jgi:hypothetical protein
MVAPFNALIIYLFNDEGGEEKQWRDTRPSGSGWLCGEQTTNVTIMHFRDSGSVLRAHVSEGE